MTRLVSELNFAFFLRLCRELEPACFEESNNVQVETVLLTASPGLVEFDWQLSGDYNRSKVIPLKFIYIENLNLLTEMISLKAFRRSSHRGRWLI